MKVSLNSFRQAVANFEGRIVDTFDSSVNKFIVASAIASSGGAIDSLVAPYVDKDGMVDTDVLKSVLKAGMDAVDGKLVVKPNVPHPMRLLGVSVDEIRIKREDIEQMFAEMEGK